MAGEVSAALQEEHRYSRKEVREWIAEGNWSEYEESVRSDALHGIDLVAAKSAAKFHLMPSQNPTERSRDIKGVLVSLPRARNWIAHRCKTSYLDERWTRGRGECRVILKAQIGGKLMIDVLIEQELVAEIGESRDANDGGRKNVSLLHDEILRTIFLPNGKSRNVRA